MPVSPEEKGALSDFLASSQKTEPISPTRPSSALPVSEDELIAFDDPIKKRTRYYSQVQKAIEAAFPVKNDKYTLTVNDLTYDSSEEASIAEQKKAVLAGTSLTRKLTGKYTLTDNATGQVVSQSGKKTLINVPKMLNDGTFLRDGTAYSIANQFRLVPAVYTRITADGYPEAQFNLKPRTGPSLRIYMEPESSVYYMTIRGRKVPLYHVLNKMGVQDEQLIAEWGEDIFNKNKQLKMTSHATKWMTDVALEGEKRYNKMVASGLITPDEVQTNAR